jgi:hypothetical protein
MALGWPLAPGEALVEATDVAVQVAAAHQTDRVRGFAERPLAVAVDVRARAPVAQLATGRVNAVDASGAPGACSIAMPRCAAEALLGS